MVFTLTVIRLSLDTKQFQNTERNQIVLSGELEKELANHKADFEQVERALSLEVSNTITIEVEDTLNNKLWFYYITRFN